MPKTTIKNIQIFAIAVLLFGCAIIINILNNNNRPPLIFLILGLAQTTIYIFLYCAWGISIRLRISQTQIRFFLQVIASLLVFWIALRAVKYYIVVEGGVESRYLWYLFYVPMLLIPLLSFFVALSIGKPDSYRIPKWNILLFIFWIFLITMVLTNDIHRLVFTFPNETLEYADAKHGYGLVYLLIYLWMLCISGASLCILIFKCRIPDIKKVFWFPAIPIIISFVYSLCYSCNIIRAFRDINVVFTAAIVASLEVCIQCGLIRSNSGYIELFEVGSYGAQITNKSFVVEYSSSSAIDIPYDLMHETKSKTLKIGDNTLLNIHSITNGHIIWNTDITELNKLLERLRRDRESLAESVTLEEKNYKAKLKINALKEKNSLYEKLQNQIAGQIELLYKLLDLYDKETNQKKKKRLLAMISVVGTYVKRRGNLLFLAEKSNILDCTDLTLCLQESVSNLELLDVNCAVLVEENASILSSLACEIYDLFERVIETAMEDMSCLLIRIDFPSGVVKLRMELECESSLSKFTPIVDKCVLDEGVWYLTNYFRKGNKQ